MYFTACRSAFNWKEIGRSLVMIKLTALILLSLCLNTSANGYAQNLSLSQNNVSINKVFREIKKQTGFTFVYKESLLKDRKVSVNVRNASLEQVLDICLKDLPLSYQIVNRIVVIKEKEPVVAVNYQAAGANAPVPIRGKVVNEKGEALAGASVAEKGKNNITRTTEEGTFTIDLAGSNSTLVISFVGYETKEVNAGNQSSLNITLTPVNASMGEVVVVGYGTVRKSDLTGSVTSLKSDDLTPGTNINIQQAMQGRAAGVQVYQKTGEPGSAISVKIRGASSITAGNEPLYVIDGMPINDAAPIAGGGLAGTPSSDNPRNPLNSLNPSDVQSIEILKDASATAIYGSRGANGVVLITTKKGTTGKLSISYNANFGVQEVTRKLDMLTGEQYRNVLNSIIDAGGGVPTERVTGPIANTDWQDQLFRKGNIQSHDLSFSGGANNTKYYVSLGYFNQEGVMKNSGTQRYTARLNLDNSVASKYAFGINLNTSYIKDKFNSNGIGINDNASSLYMAVNYDPTVAVYDSAGNYNRSALMFPMDHPVAVNEGQYGNSDSYRTFGSIYGEYFFMPSLSLRAKIGGDINNSQRNFWVDPITLLGQQNNGIAAITSGTRSYYMGEATLNYNKVVGIHSVNAVVGSTYERFGFYSFNGNGRGYTLPDLTYNAIGSGVNTLNQLGSSRAESRIVSFLGRVNYSLSNKYLLTLSMRADGSSRFGPNNRFGYFPSAALAWKLAQEKFIKGGIFDDLKLRVSYGAIGNQSINNFLFIPTFSNSGEAIFGAGTRNTAISPTRNANPDLKWEAAKQVDVGIDFALLHSRLRGSIEYYQRRTTDLLLNVPQPLSTGFSSRTENIGSMKNSGIELSLSADVIQTRDFNWNMDLNFSTLKNEVLNLGPSPQIISGGAGVVSNVSIIKPGESLGSYYGYEVLGVWQTKDDFTTTQSTVKPGDLKYKDQNGDKMITDADRVILGKAFPDYFYGINSTWSFKKFSLAVFVEGSQGGSILNNNMIDSYFPVSFRRNKLAEPYLNRWTPTNPTNEYPSFVNPTSQGQRQVNSRTVEDASYLRLQSIRLGYNLSMPGNKIFKNVGIFVMGQNLYTFTKYSGVDPAINAIGDNVLKIDYSSYPMSRTISAGVNIQF